MVNEDTDRQLIAIYGYILGSIYATKRFKLIRCGYSCIVILVDINHNKRKKIGNVLSIVYLTPRKLLYPAVGLDWELYYSKPTSI